METPQQIPLIRLKQHVRADDFTDDDDLLQAYLNAAIEATLRATNRSLEELMALGGGLMPLPVQQAVLLLAGHWYNQREAVSAGQMHAVPYGYDALVKPFRRLGKTMEGTSL